MWLARVGRLMFLTHVGRLVSLALPLALAAPAGATPAAPAGAEESPDKTLSPYFFVQGGDPETDRLPLLGTSVTVDVAGVIAAVTVKQVYENEGARPIHARYVFPASTRAAVHGLTMTVGDEVVYAKISEREKAKKKFTAAKKAGKNAALLEQQRPNVFTMDIANLVPGQRIEVELRYSELLVPEAGVYEFVYPTVVGPRYSTVPESGAASSDQWLETPYTKEGEPPSYSFSLDGTVSAGTAVRDLVSPSHAILSRAGGPSRVRFSLDPAKEDGGNRDFILRYRLDGDRIQSGLMLYEGEDESFFLLMVQPPRRVVMDQVPPREYIFVVDVSGSMSGFPLDTAKGLLRDLIGHLRPTDTFDVVLFSGSSQVWSPRSVPASPANIDEAIAVIDRHEAGGGTELLAAVREAMTLPRDEEGPRSRSIIIVTDGYIAAESEVFAYIRGNLDNANVFAFGIGQGVNRFLIEGVARAGLGEPFVVPSPSGAPEAAARFRDYVQYPMLTDVHVAFDGFAAYDVEPASIPDVMSERPIIVHGKWRGEPRGHVTVTGATGAGGFTRDFAVSDVEPDASHRALRHLWARARVADLADWGGDGETKEEREELVRLGLTYGLLTKYTSFIAVHEVIRNPSGEAEEVKQPLPLPAGVSNYAVGCGSEPGLLVLLASMLAAATAVALRRRLSRARG